MADAQTGTIVGTTSAYPEGFVPYSTLNGGSWEDETAGVFEFPGFMLLKEEVTNSLEGVPFMIVGVTYRPGIPRPGAKGEDPTPTAYVSIEARIGPRDLLTRKRVDLNSLPFDPDDHIVFNDGSTGVRRQITKTLAAMGWIKLSGERIIDSGKMGECSYDQPPTEWADVHFGEIRFDETGGGIYQAPIRLKCPRGLRLSDYENEFTNGQQATTRYIA